MAGGHGGRWGGRERGAVQAVVENRCDTLIRTGSERKGTAAGGVKPLGAIAFPQSHDASTRPEALLGMGARGEKGFHHLRGGRPTGSCPTDQPLRGPCCLMTVSRGHVRGDRAVAALKARAQMDRQTGPFVAEFKHTGTQAHLELLLDEG